MLESGIIKYGDEFMHSMGKMVVGIFLKLTELMKESKGGFRFRTDERTSGARASSTFWSLLWQNIIEMVMVKKDKVEDVFSL